jgi:hypothetical protein
MAREQELSGYVSVNLRLALMKADHPHAEIEYEVVSAEESGIHPVFRGDTQWFVTCTISAPGMTPIRSWKEVPKTVVRWVNNQRKNVPAELNPEFLVKLQTMAAGRALKQMGYPDAISDLKPLLLWRQRMREIEILGGTAVPELGKGEEEAEDPALTALAGAARPDDGENGDEVEEGEVVEGEVEPPDDRPVTKQYADGPPVLPLDQVPEHLRDRVERAQRAQAEADKRPSEQAMEALDADDAADADWIAAAQGQT